MFQSLSDAMNTGDPVVIKDAEENARKINGVSKLVVIKSFKDKKINIIEHNDEKAHRFRMIKPMIATQDCLMCHANQNEGDVIGTKALGNNVSELLSMIMLCGE
ncbi:MAG: hypothetical protein U9Q33_13455 [Campylobacterota bacterium]|nr:hypothetical protein [Campylobacterota bacterium]